MVVQVIFFIIHMIGDIIYDLISKIHGNIVFYFVESNTNKCTIAAHS